MKYSVRLKMWPAVTAAITISILPTSSHAFFRHLCHGQVGIGRIDPIISPGKTSQHVHNIQGAANFGFEPTIDQLLSSNCTSCSIRQDKSSYWQPQMYFQHDNGTFQLVPTSGGLTAYYFTETPDTGDTIHPFPKDFRMVTGNPFKRTNVGPIPDPDMSAWGPDDETQEALTEKSIGFNCMNYHPGAKTEASLEYHYLRNKTFLDSNCADGIRAEILFPSCWNGKDLDSTDHKSHVVYPSRLRNGNCPTGFGTRLPALFFETIYQTDVFNGAGGQFVLANGDPTGYGYHADFIAAWEDGVLQQVINNPSCTGPTVSGNQWDCPVFDLKSVDDPDTINCSMDIPDAIKNEQVNYVEKLPGDVSVQYGPQSATMPDMPSTPSSSAMPGAASIAPSTSPTSAAVPYTNTTAAEPVPSTTPVPNAPPATTNEIVTQTSVTFMDGTVYHWVILEEIVTTTVMANEPASAAHKKRHNHAHRHGDIR